MPTKWAPRKAAQRAFPTRPPCQQCGSARLVQRHHEDLDRPLDIQMLCQTCHVAAHVRTGTWGPRNRPEPKKRQYQRKSRAEWLLVAPEIQRANGIRAAAIRWANLDRRRVCTWCGTTFEYERARQTTCSRSCGNKQAWSSRKGSVCAHEPTDFAGSETLSSSPRPKRASASSGLERLGSCSHD